VEQLQLLELAQTTVEQVAHLLCNQVRVEMQPVLLVVQTLVVMVAYSRFKLVPAVLLQQDLVTWLVEQVAD
jgi:hypothetical protein